MAIRVRVQNDLQIIVPVRIERAVTSSPPLLDAPDPDDRGWVNNRAAGLNVNAKVRGALFGMTLGDTVKLKLVRQDLDAGVPLFVTAEGGQVQVHKDSRGILLGDSTFKVHAAQDSSSPTTIQVRLGSPTGAVICEADAHVFSPLTLNITPHVCTVSSASTPGVAPTVNGAAVDATMIGNIFALASAIWRPAGINFNVGTVLPEAFTFAQPNLVAVGERGTVLGQNQKAGTCNLYFLVAMAASTPGRITLGLGIRKETQSGTVTSSGILIGTGNRSSTGSALLQELGNDVAHEVGHFLTLSHANLVNGAGEPDTYNRRMLMHPSNLLTAAASPLTATSVPRFNDIGYGSGGSGAAHRGCLVTLKDHPQHQTDGEVMAARNRFKSVNLYA